MNTLSGPMFEPSKDEIRESIFKREGGHYNVFRFKRGMTSQELIDWYGKDNKPNEMNLWLFSTSGIHGRYTEMEEILEHWDQDQTDDDCVGHELTVLYFQPRIVCSTYGNVLITDPAHIGTFAEWRQLSKIAFDNIGGRRSWP